MLYPIFHVADIYCLPGHETGQKETTLRSCQDSAKFPLYRSLMEMFSLFKLQTLFQKRNRRWLFVVFAVALTHLMLQSLLLPYGKALRSLLPNHQTSEDNSFLPILSSSSKSSMVRNPLTVVNVPEVSKASVFVGVAKTSVKLNDGDDIHSTIELNAAEKPSNVSSTSGDGDNTESLALKGRNENIMFELGGDGTIQLNVSKNKNMISDGSLSFYQTNDDSPSFDSPIVTSPPNISFLDDMILNEMGSASSSNSSMSAKSASKNESLLIISPAKKKMRCDVPPKSVTTIEEMGRIYVRHQASSRSMV